MICLANLAALLALKTTCGGVFIMTIKVALRSLFLFFAEYLSRCGHQERTRELRGLCSRAVVEMLLCYLDDGNEQRFLVVIPKNVIICRKEHQEICGKQFYSTALAQVTSYMR